MKCMYCCEDFAYRDEIVILDCNGNNSLSEEEGGSGDSYGCVCNECYEKHYDEIMEKLK